MKHKPNSKNTYNVITLLIVLGSSRGNSSYYKTSTLKGLSQRTFVGQPLYIL